MQHSSIVQLRLFDQYVWVHPYEGCDHRRMKYVGADISTNFVRVDGDTRVLHFFLEPCGVCYELFYHLYKQDLHNLRAFLQTQLEVHHTVSFALSRRTNTFAQICYAYDPLYRVTQYLFCFKKSVPHLLQ